MTLLERRCSTLNTLLPSLCDYLHTKLSVYQSAFSFLEVNADVLVKTTSHAVLPTAGSDDLKKIAAAVRQIIAPAPALALSLHLRTQCWRAGHEAQLALLLHERKNDPRGDSQMR